MEKIHDSGIKRTWEMGDVYGVEGGLLVELATASFTVWRDGKGFTGEVSISGVLPVGGI